MLEVRNLHAYYGKSHILQGVDLDIAAGEVVSLLGRNGVGRSTTVKAIMGEVPPQGTIRFKGQDIAGLPNYRIARSGLGYVPEHRDIFPGLTVRQNLLLGVKDVRRPGKWRIDAMLEMFPNLAARADTPAGVLSGGEKQMLTVCRTLMGDPELIMIDEPTRNCRSRCGFHIASTSWAMAASCSRAPPTSFAPTTPSARNGWRCDCVPDAMQRETLLRRAGERVLLAVRGL
jgi:ABC-type branched-subunit amino acid transport system ATPase component